CHRLVRRFAKDEHPRAEGRELVNLPVDHVAERLSLVRIGYQLVKHRLVFGAEHLRDGSVTRAIPFRRGARAFYQQVRHAAHRRSDNDHLMAIVNGLSDNSRRVPQGFGIADRGPSEFHGDASHKRSSCQTAVTDVLDSISLLNERAWSVLCSTL